MLNARKPPQRVQTSFDGVIPLPPPPRQRCHSLHGEIKCRHNFRFRLRAQRRARYRPRIRIALQSRGSQLARWDGAGRRLATLGHGITPVKGRYRGNEDESLISDRDKGLSLSFSLRYPSLKGVLFQSNKSNSERRMHISDFDSPSFRFRNDKSWCIYDQSRLLSFLECKLVLHESHRCI